MIATKKYTVDYLNALTALEQKQLTCNNVQQVFPSEMYRLKEADIKIEHSLRRDFCSQNALTIDSSDSKDLDDAVHVSVARNGVFTLTVHIADVSSFVPFGSKLDELAIKRATSVYLPNMTLAMLPPIISENLGSLNPGVKRNTISVIMKIDKRGQLLETCITKGKIVSRVKGVYSEVNNLINGTANSQITEKYQEVYSVLLDMVALYKVLRSARIKRGSIPENNNSPKIKITENEVTIKPNKRGIAEDMIEECMLMCNNSVALYMHEQHLPVIYRTQEEKGKHASYSVEKSQHSDLQLEKYVHFSSPIRRLADLKNHQILSMHLNGYSAKEIHDRFDNVLPEICEIATKRFRTAKQIQDICTRYCYVMYFIQHSSDTYTGVVIGYDSKKFPIIKMNEFGIPLLCRSISGASIGEKYSFHISAYEDVIKLFANNPKRLIA